MRPEIILVISQTDKVIQTVNKQLNEQGFVKSIEDFQITANTIMTKLIDDSGDSGDCIMEEDADDSENEEEDEIISPKKRRNR